MQSKVTGQCHFCLQTKELCEAHIFPRAFGKEIQKAFKDNGPLWGVELNKKREAIRNQGYFDPNILCEKCDQLLGQREGYLIEFFRGNVAYDYKKIKLSLLGILWKTHISKYKELNHLTLEDKVANRIYEMLKNEDPGDEEEFAFWLKKFINKTEVDEKGPLNYIIDYGDVISNPDGIFYISQVGGYKIIVKIGPTKLPSHCKNFLKSNTDNIEAITYEYSDTIKDTNSMEHAFYRKISIN